MKEYLIKKGDGSYFNQMACDREAREPHAKDWIEIPEGAEFATSRGEVVVFWGADGDKVPMKHLLDIKLNDAVDRLGGTIVWQRHPEADPIVSDNTKHSHYFKDVSHLDTIDVYRVLDLFEVKSHAVGHAIKKLLCSGGRGAKDEAQDIQEAIDTLVRYQEMVREDD